jgi:hypothetical protein
MPSPRSAVAASDLDGDLVQTSRGAELDHHEHCKRTETAAAVRQRAKIFREQGNAGVALLQSSRLTDPENPPMLPGISRHAAVKS